MKILYSLPHPADRLVTQRAGHVIRAKALLDALQTLGHDVIRIEAAANSRAAFSVGIYRGLIRKLLPRSIAMRLRDRGRIQHGRRYAERLIEAAHQHRPDLILETHIAFSLAGKIASERTGIPLILDDCSPAWEEEQQYGVGLKEEALQIHKEVTTHASLVVAVNKTMRGHLLNEGLSPEAVITVENGFDDSIFHPGIDGHPYRQKYQIPDDAVVVVFVGSFQPYHRVDLLLEALHVIKEQASTYLLLVGDGTTLPACQAQAARLGLLDRVRFTGRVLYSDVPFHIAAGDIAVMPATNDYGNPMKIYEYMALGKAVVAPNQPTITEIATHEQDAFLFDTEKVSSLAWALNTLVGDGELRGTLSQNGAKRAAGHSWNKRALVLQDAMMRVLMVSKNGVAMDETQLSFQVVHINSE
jgi:glycosyltransferase involved in cell wall biosynthesis